MSCSVFFCLAEISSNTFLLSQVRTLFHVPPPQFFQQLIRVIIRSYGNNVKAYADRERRAWGFPKSTHIQSAGQVWVERCSTRVRARSWSWDLGNRVILRKLFHAILCEPHNSDVEASAWYMSSGGYDVKRMRRNLNSLCPAADLKNTAVNAAPSTPPPFYAFIFHFI